LRRVDWYHLMLDDNTRPDAANDAELQDDTQLEDQTCDPIELLATDFTERQRRGEQPSIADYAERHPDIADRIRRLFPLLVAVEQVKVGGQQSSDGRASTAGHQISQLGDFRIIRERGRGGMGIVYEAEQESLNRRVAIKILPPQSIQIDRSLERFQREARTAAKLHHSNIVPVFGTGEENGVHYLVMQLIAGDSLDRWTKAAKPGTPDTQPDANAEPAIRTSLGPQDVAKIGRQIADAVTYAHREKVLHRDLKPANILVDESQHVWVTDFGLAQCLNDDMTVTQSLGGSLRYMPPERFQGEGDERSDVYSIGVTLYELAVGGPAFQADNATQLIAKIGNGEVARLRAVMPGFPRDLETIIAKAMHRESRFRYASAAALLEDLERFIDGRTILARRARVHERCWRWARRNPLLAGACSLTALAILLAFAALASGYSAAADANQRAKLAYRRESVARAKAEHTVELALSVLNNVVEEMTPGSMSFEPLLESMGEEEDPVFSAVVNAPSPQVAKILEQLIPLYGELAEQAGGRNDIARQAATAGARLGRIHFHLGNTDEAASTLKRSIKILTEVPRVERDLQWAQEIAVIGNDLGGVQAAQFRFADAIKSHRNVLAVIADFSSEQNDDVLLRFEFGRAHYSLGKNGRRRVAIADRGPVARGLNSRGRPLLEADELAEHFERAIDSFESLQGDEKIGNHASLSLAKTLRARIWMRGFRSRDERDGDYRRVRETLESLVSENPQEPAYQFELAQALAGGDFSVRAMPQARTVPAARWRTIEGQLRRSLRILTELSDTYPTVPLYAVAQAEVHYRLSIMMGGSERNLVARQHLRSALAITQELTTRFPDQISYFVLRFRLYRSLIHSYEAADDLAGKAEIIEELEAEHATLPSPIANRSPVREVIRSIIADR
jgi:tetratricopeptide (TPR) repeat protein/tRNA A-37 threonylcarbamoyl transferase component Bud32